MAPHKCGKNNERVVIQLAGRPAGASIPVEMRFKNARTNGTLRLDIACASASPTAAPSLLPWNRDHSTSISCGDPVSLDVGAGGELRRFF